MTTSTYNIRMDSGLKKELDKTAQSIGLTPAAAFNVFARQFVAHRGFPFDVVAPVPSEQAFSEQMDDIYDEMLAGSAEKHDLIES